MSSSTFINEGVWIDWSRGSLTGLTITLRTRDAAVLISFLSLFTSMAGSFLWRLVKFTTHQLKAQSGSGPVRDGHWASQMIILRNSGTPSLVLFDALRTVMAWRTLSLGSLALILLAAVFAPLLGITSILSSKIIEPDLPLGRMSGNDCGYWSVTDVDAYRIVALLNETLPAVNYAESCYTQSSDSVLCSHSFVQSTIEFGVETDVECPFGADDDDNSLCIAPAIRMDSDFIDTRDNLGLNTPDADRLFYRHVTTCAPINANAYLTDAYETFGPIGNTTSDKCLFYWLGDFSTNNYTYRYNKAEYYGQGGYDLAPVFYWAGIDGNIYNPIEPLLATPDADVSVFFLAANQVRSPEPIADPWFAAHNNWTGWYLADYYVTVLACIDQNQICTDSSLDTCTSLVGQQQLTNATLDLEVSDLQLNILARFKKLYLDSATMADAVQGRGSSALQAAKTVYAGNGFLDQAALPINQWQIEVKTWFDVQMARLQRVFVDSAGGPDLASYIKGEWQPFNDLLCNSQLVPLPTGYQSMNFAAILLVLVIGIIFIVLGAVVPSAVVAISKRRRRDSPGWLAWTLDNKFQLQRLAQESAGWGVPWQRQLTTVPRAGGLGQVGGYRVASHGMDVSSIERPGLSLSMAQPYGPVVMEDVHETGYDGVAKSPVIASYAPVYTEEH